MSKTISMRPAALSADPQWYKDAIIYEARTRSYFDSNGDGVGDLAGLCSKIDYLKDLGVTAIWLLPICPSPGRDDGYDIADYTDVHPAVGTLADFRHLLDEAHRRGIRIITELVLNHTSDQHPWFQRARRAPSGSPERSFYVWSDGTDLYREARIIFKDFEPSNWSWDPVAKAHYWHRFYAHQPDLNFDNLAVHDALLEVVDFWFGLGVDGLRLDAVPYLYERDGTNCENLPETHAFLRKLRAHIDAKFQGRLLLAEANQWPEDAAAYFGRGDECHMNFHFPIMPRMFMAIRMEDRFPIIDIMAQTPEIHPTCQWALFLRNHDELTLEMVTDEERDYMYQAYAHETSMRLNLGIRRRLAPLVGNDRRMMELLNGLLFSLPGTPVIYYGDEIGMGDNVFLGDRNGVRTPMQWSSDRNAGFSRASPQRLVLPVIIDPEYHFESLNVEAQQSNPSSLLWWTKRLIALRKRFRSFGRGTIEFLHPTNPHVLAFVRQLGDEIVLVVANLSRSVQFVEIDLTKNKGLVPVELFGRTRFPIVGETPYMLTLGGHAFYWFSLEKPKTVEQDARTSAYEPPTIECTSHRSLLLGDSHRLLEEALPTFLESRKWFEGRGRGIGKASVLESISLDGDEGRLALVIAQVEYAEGDPDTYVLPLGFPPPPKPRESMRPPSPAATFAHVHIARPGHDGITEDLVDVLEDPELCRSLLAAILEQRRTSGTRGELVASLVEPVEVDAHDVDAHVLTTTHWNVVVQYGEHFFLKLFRRMEEGTSPELEVGRFLARKAPGLVPAVPGAIEYKQGQSEPVTIAVLERFIPNEGTAWDYTRRELSRFYERVLARPADSPVPALPRGSLADLAATPLPADVGLVTGAYSEIAALLGKRVGEMHLALASDVEDPSFAPEVYSVFDRRSRYQSLRNLAGKVLRTLRIQPDLVPPEATADARALVAREKDVFKRFEPILHEPLSYSRIRLHGDLHLDQALYTGKDFLIIDFDGGRERRLSERRRKRSALRDVAGIIGSLHRAAFTALFTEAIVRETDRKVALPWSRLWHQWASVAFLGGYFAAVNRPVFLPTDPAQLSVLLDSFVLERALEELSSELRKGAATMSIPLDALTQMLAE